MDPWRISLYRSEGGVMSRISRSEAERKFKKWEGVSLILVDADYGATGPRENSVSVTLSGNKLVISREGEDPKTLSLADVGSFDVPEQVPSDYADLLNVKFPDGKSLVFVEPKRDS